MFDKYIKMENIIKNYDEANTNEGKIYFPSCYLAVLENT